MDKIKNYMCVSIAQHYGQAKQEIQAVQELSELICLLTRRKDQRGGDYMEKLIDEIADCLIMIKQIQFLNRIPSDEINKQIDRKLSRQIERIRKEGLENEP